MLRIGTFLFLVLLGAAARAEAPRRVLIVDAVTLSPGLERGNARQKMLEAVTAGTAQHGWEAVASSDCHDFTCVGPAAAAAKVSYALILTAGFAHGSDVMYATDVGVSLWRDGSVVARWTEEDEKAEAEKNPASVFFACGPPGGTCVAPLLASKMQQYSAHLLDGETKAVEAAAATAAAVKAPASPPAAPVLVAPVTAGTATKGGGTALGWTLIGVGALGVGGGLALWAYDHSATDCHSVAGSGCREGRATGTAAAVVGGVGVAAGAAGVLVLVLDRDGSRVGLSVWPGGLALSGGF